MRIGMARTPGVDGVFLSFHNTPRRGQSHLKSGIAVDFY
jgi:hypothetical protein